MFGPQQVIFASADDSKIAWYENLLECERPGFDDDGAVDLGDLVTFQAAFTGSE